MPGVRRSILEAHFGGARRSSCVPGDRGAVYSRRHLCGGSHAARASRGRCRRKYGDMPWGHLLGTPVATFIAATVADRSGIPGVAWRFRSDEGSIASPGTVAPRGPPYRPGRCVLWVSASVRLFLWRGSICGVPPCCDPAPTGERRDVILSPSHVSMGTHASSPEPARPRRGNEAPPQSVTSGRHSGSDAT